MTKQSSRLGNLIKKYCPNGVKFKELYKLTIWDKRFDGVEKEKQPNVRSFKHISAAKLKSLYIKGSCNVQNNVRLLSTGQFDGYTAQELVGDNLNNDEVIAIPSGGSANLKYCKGKFVDSGNILAIARDENVRLKYVYYFLLDKNRLIESYFRGSGLKHPSMREILEIKIPVPAIEVQEEIVRILDTFTQLESELESELELRTRQYEYYRNSLLSFESDKSSQVKSSQVKSSQVKSSQVKSSKMASLR
ncbi:MAG: restriction endonuclease subunit S [Endomicrobium sp.]|nr:restriction endonuclease subunit S [Endomicrobium sp.]